MYNINEVNDSPDKASLNFTLLPSWRPLRAEKKHLRIVNIFILTGISKNTESD